MGPSLPISLPIAHQPVLRDLGFRATISWVVASCQQTGQQTGQNKRVNSFVASCWLLLERYLTRLAPDAIHFGELSTTSDA